MSAPERLRVELGARSYDILVGENLIDRAGEVLQPFVGAAGVAVVTDSNVADRHLSPLRRSLDAARIAHRAIVLPPGEQTKDLTHFGQLTNELLAGRIERGSVLVALGGGVIGDLVGFAAATLLRGIGFVQVPTTLLAQVDSSVGGKTGINTEYGKNLIGAFHQPRLVLADIGTLATLPLRELRAGYAEIVKYGLIRDAGFFDWLERAGARLLAGDTDARRRAVVESCRAKAAVVAADERESGERALLNFGHTFGHALEAETGYTDALLHGEAVAIGMVLAFDFSVRCGLCPAADAERVRRHLVDAGLPTTPPPELAPERLVGHMRNDKKVLDGTLTFILTKGIGKAFVARDVAADELRSFLADIRT
jgi:3-dehydroquinate synthase